MVNLGRLDSLHTQKTIDQLIEGLAKFSHKKVIIDLSHDLFADWAKMYGPVLIFKALWERIGLKQIIKGCAEERKFEFDPKIF